MRRLIAVCLVVLAAGCAPSLSPVYTEKDLVFEPGLLGTWSTEKPEDGTWMVEQKGGNAYTVRFTEKGKTGACRGHLVRLGGMLVMDLFPEGAEYEGLGDLTKVHTVPTHTVNRIWIEGDTVRYATLDGDRLKDLSAAGELAIPHTQTDGKILLTARPAELQAFLVKHASDPKLFSGPVVLKRKK